MTDIEKIQQEIQELKEQLRVEQTKAKVENLPIGIKRFVDYRLGILDGTIQHKRNGPTCEEVKIYLDKNWSVADIAYKLGTSNATVNRRIRELHGKEWRWRPLNGSTKIE